MKVRRKSTSSSKVLPTDAEYVYWFEHLDDEQLGKLKTLKQAVFALSERDELMEKDTDFARYLKARSWDVEKALEMYTNTVKWRSDFGCNSIFDGFDFPEKREVIQIFPQYYLRTDKFGRPIFINEVGKISVEKLLKVTTVERMLQFHVYEWEKLIREMYPACSKHVGHNIFQSFSIIDLKGLSYKQFNKTSRTFIQKVTKLDQEYFPEHLGQMFIVNAPKIFTMMWSVIKLWLDKRTLMKIKVYGSDFKEKILQYIDPDDLPDTLGGNLVMSDEVRMSNSGPWNQATASGKEGAGGDDAQAGRNGSGEAPPVPAATVAAEVDFAKEDASEPPSMAGLSVASDAAPGDERGRAASEYYDAQPTFGSP